jgi:hypothetical protein
MTMKLGTSSAVAAVAGAAMLVLAMSPASAFTLSTPGLDNPSATQIEKVWWRGGGWRGGGWHGGWRGGGWGWRGGWRGPGWGWRGPGWGGGCWRGYYGRLYCN